MATTQKTYAKAPPSAHTRGLVPDVDRALEKGNVGLARRLLSKHLATGAKVADEARMKEKLTTLGPDAFPYLVGMGALGLYTLAWAYALAWQKF